MKKFANIFSKKGFGLSLLVASLSVLAIVLSIYLALLGYSTFRGGIDYYGNFNTITISKTATVDAVPDMATFTFTVKSEGESSDKISEGVNDTVNELFAKLEDIGVGEKDLKTLNVSMNPIYKWVQKCSGCASDRVRVGFEYSQRISVKLRDFDKIPDVMKLLSGEGVYSLSGPSFVVEDLDSYRLEAKKKAIEKAWKEAEVVAKSLGGHVVKIVDYYESGGYGGYYPEGDVAYGATMKAVGGEAVPEVREGEQKVSATVNMVFRIK